ncbi:nitroreductase family protein [Cytobacillus firmus]|uniref:nitroreductase family protein n=1 Tax=Cytobacillus firmus TaxID=1399 RepID=UPI0020792121|nr:nitroreductase family protein [Cytobacillus firmus]USK39683.1 nitroreductase family protein [Cytobacillus firmus]
MDIQKIITTRRNIKKFKPDEVEHSLITTWLEAATMAPNHKMTEPWEVLFAGPETRAQLNHKTDFGGAPVVLAILSKHGATALERTENMAAVSCFIQNFMLMAWESGVGTFWSSLGTSAKSRMTLNVPDDYDVVGILGVGFPEEVPEEKERTPIDRKIKHLS